MDNKLSSPLTILKQAWALALSRPNRIVYVTLGTLPIALSFGLSTIVSYFKNTSTDLETLITNLLNTAGAWGIVGLMGIVIIGILVAVAAFIGTWYTAFLYKVFQATATKTTTQFFEFVRPAKQVTMRLFKTSLHVGLVAVLGYLFFIVPGIIITVRYAFAPFIATSEGNEVKPIEESERLVKGRFWKLAGYFLISFIFSSIPLFILQSLHPLLGSVWSVSSPIFGLYFYLVYLDFKRTTTAIA